MRFRSATSCIVLLAAMLAGCSAPSASVARAHDDSALVVPLLASQPILDEKIQEDEWAEAQEIHGDFVIADGTPAAGRHAFTLRMGATAEGLHLAFRMPEFPANPWNTANVTYSDCVVFFFADDAPALASPSFAVVACAGVDGYSSAQPAYWSGAEWVLDDDPESGSFNKGRPAGGTWAFGNVLNGTLFFEVYTMRHPKETTENGLRLEPGTTFRMSLLFTRIGLGEGSESPDARGPFTRPHDAFPGDGYTPHAHYDPSGWIRLRMAS